MSALKQFVDTDHRRPATGIRVQHTRRWKRENGQWNNLFYLPSSIINLRMQIFVLCLVSLLFGCSSPASADRVCFKRDCFDVELAITESERQQGLMDREFLAPYTGMLFIFSEEGTHPFWMKNTLIPLDIIWLDRNRRVVHIERGVPPCTHDPCPQYEPEEDALYVIEFNAGLADDFIIKEGDEAEIELRD